MDFYPPGKSKHIFWLKNSQKREGGAAHWWPDNFSLSPRNEIEARNLGTKPQRYFCIFASTTQCSTSLDLPSQNLPSLHFWSLPCGRTGAGQQQEESRGQGLSSQDSWSPLSLSAASLSMKGRNSWTLSPGTLPSYSAPSIQEWSPLVPLEVLALEVRGADSECKEQLWDPFSPPPLPPPVHPPRGTLCWAEPHPRFPRCARYTSWSGASG